LQVCDRQGAKTAAAHQVHRRDRLVAAAARGKHDFVHAQGGYRGWPQWVRGQWGAAGTAAKKKRSKYLVGARHQRDHGGGCVAAAGVGHGDAYNLSIGHIRDSLRAETAAAADDDPWSVSEVHAGVGDVDAVN